MNGAAQIPSHLLDGSETYETLNPGPTAIENDMSETRDNAAPTDEADLAYQEGYIAALEAMRDEINDRIQAEKDRPIADDPD